MSHAAYHHGWWVLERPVTPIGAQMNVGYALAVAIIDKAAMVKQFAPQRIDSDDVWALIPKITAHHEPNFDRAPATGHTRVVVVLQDGTTLEHLVEAPRTVGRPLSNVEVLEKYNTLTTGPVDRERQRAIAETVLNLERVPNVKRLSSLMKGEVKTPFD